MSAPMTEFEMQLLAVLDRIARGVETIAMSNATAPAFNRPMSEYKDFDWSSIGATVTETDRDGVSVVEWGGYNWKRRNPSNNFDNAIFYTRPIGKKEDGSNKYARLITFKEVGKVKSLNRDTEELVESAAAKKKTGPLPSQVARAAMATSREQQPPAGIEHLPARKTDVPSYCHLHLCDMTANAIGLYTHGLMGGGLCNGTTSLPDTPDRCALHVVTMSEQSKTGVPFHRILDAKGDTTAYCDGSTVKPNGNPNGKH